MAAVALHVDMFCDWHPGGIRDMSGVLDKEGDRLILFFLAQISAGMLGSPPGVIQSSKESWWVTSK